MKRHSSQTEPCEQRTERVNVDTCLKNDEWLVVSWAWWEMRLGRGSSIWVTLDCEWGWRPFILILNLTHAQEAVF